MSAKFKRQQKKRRWSESGTVFPSSFITTLQGINADDDRLPGVKKVAAGLLNLANLRFTYGEVEDLKHIVGVLQGIPDQDDRLLEYQQAAALILELLFLDNSRPLHRHILSHFKKLSPRRADAVGEVLVERVLLQIQKAEQDARTAEPGEGKGSHMPAKVLLGQSVSSLLALGPQAHQWLRRCCGSVVICMSRSIHQVLKAAEGGAHVAPTLMLDVQEAISAVYYLLQHHGERMVAEDAEKGAEALQAAALMALCALQGQILVREALASAAVVVWAAAVLPQQPPMACLLKFAAGLLNEGDALLEDGHVREHLRSGSNSILDGYLKQQGTSLVEELRKSSPLGRICTLKGLLTSIPMHAMCTPLDVKLGPQQDTVCWTWLSKGVIPTACQAVSESKDAHFKFHAMCTINIALQQILNSWHQAAMQPGGLKQLVKSASTTAAAAALTEELSDLHINLDSDDEEGQGTAGADAINTAGVASGAGKPNGEVPLFLPIRLDIHDRDMIMNLLWGNLDEPLAQTVKQVQEAFDSLLSVLLLQEQYMGSAAANDGAHGLKAFMHNTAASLLASRYNRKGRYLPLSSLVNRLGAETILRQQPELVYHTLRAMQDDMVSNSASAFFKTLMQDLRSRHGPEDDWKRWWMPAVLDALHSSSDKLRQYVSVHAIPVLLGVEPALLLDLISNVVNTKQAGGTSCQVAALVAVLKAGRSLQLLGDLDTLQAVGSKMALDPCSMLMEAACQSSEALRLDCLELACVNPRESEAPGELEVALIGQWLQYNLRTSSQGYRNKCMACIARLLRRVRTSVHSALHRLSVKSPGAQGGKHSATARRSRSVNVLGASHAADWGSNGGGGKDPADVDREAVARMQKFMCSFTAFLLASMYPGAPYQRKYFALELMNQVLDTWLDAFWIKTPLLPKPPGPDAYEALLPFQFQPWCDNFLSFDTVQLLLSSVIDSWDKLRQSAMMAFMKFPHPLPGLETPEKLQPLLMWANELNFSPRVRESDAGARLAKFFFNKYSVQLQWHVTMFPEPAVTIPAACPDSAKGWSTNAGGPGQAFKAQHVMLHSLLEQLESRIAEGKRDLVSACSHSLAHGTLLSLRYLVEDVAWSQLSREPDQLTALQQWFERLLAALMALCNLAVPYLCKPQDAEGAGGDEMDEGDTTQEDVADGEDGHTGLASEAQILITGCWTSVKEVSLLLGTIAEHVPMPGERDVDTEEDDSGARASLLQAEQLGAMGQLLLELLFKMKHNGAVEKSAVGLTTLCQRLLRCSVTTLNQLPMQWMQTCFEQLLRGGQCLDDIVRRSAGLPFAFCSLFLAEPPNTPRVLLPSGLSKLLKIATAEVDADKWHQVHAFNTLRMAFNDSTMAVDTSGFFAEGVKASVLALAGPHWEVRNAASLCFTALCTRVLGMKNMASVDAPCKRSVTGSDFFLRYPALHSFLLSQLQEAADSLEAGAGTVHPSLYPVLIILSRLRPSLLLQESQDPFNLSPTAFTPVVSSCAAARYLAVRHLAARALCPLVAPLDLPKMLQDILQQLPEGTRVSNHNATHGQLLLTWHLLEHSGPNIQPQALQEFFSSTVELVQHKVVWLAFDCPAATVRQEALMVIWHYLNLASSRAQSSELTTLALQVFQRCTAAVRQPYATNCDHHDPGHSLALEVAVRVLLGPPLVYILNTASSSPSASAAPDTSAQSAAATEPQNSASPTPTLPPDQQALGVAGPSRSAVPDCGSLARQSVLLLLHHQSYEVRNECLTCLADIMMESDLRGLLTEEWLQQLRSTLWKLVQTEHHYKVQRQMLDVLGKLELALDQLHPPVAPHVHSDPDKAASDPDKAASDPDKATSDPDKAASDPDKATSDPDEAASNPDKAASDPVNSHSPHMTHTEKSDEASAFSVHDVPATSGTQSENSVPHVRVGVLNHVRMLDSMKSGQLRDPALQAAWLKCYGHAIGRVLHEKLPLMTTDGSTYEGTIQHECLMLLQAYLQRVESASASTEPEELRLAAVESLAASQLTRQKCQGANSWMEGIVVQVWRCVIQLLEDEEDVVRLAAAQLAQHTLKHTWAQEFGNKRGQMCVEAVERKVLEYVSSEFSGLPLWFSHLQDLVLTPEVLDDLFIFQDHTPSDGKSSTVVGGIMVRRLFDKETDNHYEEPLLLAQLAALDARLVLKQQLVNLREKQVILQAIERHITAAACLSRLTQALANWQQHTTWLGSVSSHPDLLVPLYRTLLALWTTQPVLAGINTSQGDSGTSIVALRESGDKCSDADQPALQWQATTTSDNRTVAAVAADNHEVQISEAGKKIAWSLQQLRHMGLAHLLDDVTNFVSKHAAGCAATSAMSNGVSTSEVTHGNEMQGILFLLNVV